MSYSGINTFKSSEHFVRMTLSCVFAVLHLTFSIFFGRALERWDWTTLGRCYNTRLVSYPGVVHPTVDRIYLCITCCFTLKLPSPIPVTRTTPSHLAQALLRHCSGIDQELTRKIIKYSLDE